MTPTEALREMLDRTGTSMYALSKEMGKSANYVQSTIRQGSDIGAMKLAEMAGKMGYRVVVVKDGEDGIAIGEG